MRVMINPELFNEKKDLYPLNCLGTVYENLPENDWVKVKWDNFTHGEYSHIVLKRKLIIVEY